MQSKLFLSALALGAVALLATASNADALVIAQPPGAARAIQADVIVTGKVTEIEAKEIQLAPYAGAPNKVSFKIAVVAVDEVVKGAAGQKTIRVAFQAPTATPPGVDVKPLPGGGARPPISSRIIRPTGVQLQKGTDGLFYLARTAQEGVYQAPQYYDVVARVAPTFKKDVSDAKEIGKLLADPMAALKDPLREKRVKAACMLITAYRTGRNGTTKLEPIDAEESKLILSALALADWDQIGRNDGAINLAIGGRQNEGQELMNAFNMLGLTAKDGWQQPQLIQNISDLTGPMQQWLANNAGTYRIQRIVAIVAVNPPTK